MKWTGTWNLEPRTTGCGYENILTPTDGRTDGRKRHACSAAGPVIVNKNSAWIRPTVLRRCGIAPTNLSRDSMLKQNYFKEF